jgi:hypothetical protein
MLSEVAPENVLVIDKRQRNSKFATSSTVVQRVLDSIGTAHSLQLSRLWTSKRFLLLEGDDLDILSPINNTIVPKRGSSP